MRVITTLSTRAPPEAAHHYNSPVTMKLFSRTNPRTKRGRTAKPSRKSHNATSTRRNNTGPVTTSSATPLTLSLPPNIKRNTSASSDSCSCSSTASLSSRTASTATASTAESRRIGSNATAGANGMALDVSSGHRKKEKVQSGGGRIQQCTTGIDNNTNIICGTAVKSIPASSNVSMPSPLSPSDSHSSDEPYHQPYIASAYYPEGTISHLENEVAKLSAAIKRHRKYTPEWFVLDTKLNAAKEELIAVKEDRDLDFLDGDGGIPETVLVRSEEKVEEAPSPPESGIIEQPRPECPDATARVSSTRQEYERAVQKLTTVEKFSDEWFLLQEEVIELRTKLRLEEEGDGATSETYGSPSDDSVLSKNLENLTLLTLKDNEQEHDEAHLSSYPLPPATLTRALSDSRANNDSKDDLFPLPYHERSSSLPSTSSLFLPSRRSMSPPLLLRCSPPSSPLVSRNLFPSSASINSSYYSNVDDDEDDMDERSNLFSTLTHEESHLAKLRSDYAEACSTLDTFPKFSKEWFEQKAKVVSFKEQVESLENASMGGERSVGGLSYLSFGMADRSNAAWSEEDDEIMSFASDLELVMIGEALKQGNCLSPIARDDYEYFRDDDLLPEETDFGVDAHQDKEQLSATLIQSQWRQFCQLKSFRRMVSTAIRLQAFIRCKLHVSKYKQQRRKLITLQSSVRRYRATSKYRHVLISAARIQLTWRRKYRMKADKSNTLQAMASVQSPVQRWLTGTSYVSKCASAIVIQNSWRGWSQRLNFLKAWKATVCIQSYFRMNEQQRNYRRISSNVMLVQRVFRGWYVRRQIRQENNPDTLCIHHQHVFHPTSIIGACDVQNPRNGLDELMPVISSIQCIRKKQQELSLKRSQVLKFSDEWFYATEQLQDLNDELQFIEREQLHTLIEELQSIEGTFDSRQDYESSYLNFAKGRLSSSMREDASPSGHVMRIVQSIEQSIEAQTISCQSSPGFSLFGSGYINVSPNNLSSVSSNSTLISSEEEDNLKRLGRECLRLTLELENLPNFSEEWFHCKVELKMVTEELEFLYSHSMLSER